MSQPDASTTSNETQGKTPGKTDPKAPRDDDDAARRSGQFGSDKPGAEQSGAPERPADKTPHPKGPEYEEGGPYPGTRKPGN